MQATQPLLIPLSPATLADNRFPSTRYQGSKRKLLEWIWENVCALPFDSVLDVFGGTGAVSYLFKCAGKRVVYNDSLRFNTLIAKALIENNNAHLSQHEVDQLLNLDVGDTYSRFIQNTFPGIFYTDDENRWLDRVRYAIETQLVQHPYKQAIAYFALFQACIAKRPYNLFHRANLYMRTASVERTFGNKATWDRPFADHFRAFVQEANAAVFDNGKNHQVLHQDATALSVSADLVYLDPPYINNNGVGVDYRDFYHFLEGMTLGAEWEMQIDHKSRHRRLKPQKSVWASADTILQALEELIARHRDSIIVISYRDDGIPSKAQLVGLLSAFKRDVSQATLPKKYVLSTRSSNEVLLIAK
jgi:adenine-specific DNA-methyltransferase